MHLPEHARCDAVARTAWRPTCAVIAALLDARAATGRRSATFAGFDLGAYTALAWAGEQIRGAEVGTGRVTLRAAIALSPYANHAEGAMDARYRALRSPVLSIASDIDAYPLGPAGELRHK